MTIHFFLLLRQASFPPASFISLINNIILVERVEEKDQDLDSNILYQNDQ